MKPFGPRVLVEIAEMKSKIYIQNDKSVGVIKALGTTDIPENLKVGDRITYKRAVAEFKGKMLIV